MKRVVFLIPDEILSKWLMPLLPHLSDIQDLTIENVHSVRSAAPKLQAPPAKAFAKFQERKAKKRVGRPPGSRSVARGTAGEVQQLIRDNFFGKEFRAGDVQAELRDSAYPSKTISNNMQALKMKGLIAAVSGDKYTGFVYRFTETPQGAPA